MLYKTGNKAFDDAALAAESARQAALVGLTDQNTINIITRNYLQTLINAGAANNVATINERYGVDAIKLTGAAPVAAGPTTQPFTIGVSQIGGPDALP